VLDWPCNSPEAGIAQCATTYASDSETHSPLSSKDLRLDKNSLIPHETKDLPQIYTNHYLFPFRDNVEAGLMHHVMDELASSVCHRLQLVAYHPIRHDPTQNEWIVESDRIHSPFLPSLIQQAVINGRT